MRLFNWLIPAAKPREFDPAILPHWARVAYAARCARRVQVAYIADWPDAPAHHEEALERALHFAEVAAADGQPPLDPNAIVTAAMIAAGAALHHGKATASLAASAARCAAQAVGGGPDRSGESAWEAFGFARDVATRLNMQQAIEAMSDEFFQAATLAERHKWTDTTPVTLP